MISPAKILTALPVAEKPAAFAALAGVCLERSPWRDDDEVRSAIAGYARATGFARWDRWNVLAARSGDPAVHAVRELYDRGVDPVQALAAAGVTAPEERAFAVLAEHFRAWWSACGSATELLRAAEELAPRAEIVRAACACARTVLPLVPAGEDRPRRAIEVTEAWARGDATVEAMRDAQDEARAASEALRTAGGNVRALRRASLAASAAASLAATTVWVPYSVAAAQVSVNQTIERDGPNGPRWNAAVAPVQAQLADLVRAVLPCPAR